MTKAIVKFVKYKRQYKIIQIWLCDHIMLGLAHLSFNNKMWLDGHCKSNMWWMGMLNDTL